MFLGYYSQYTLDSLRTMPPDDFLFLLGALLDATNPDATDPVEVVAARRMREHMVASMKRR